MARRKRPVHVLPTIWKVPDELWELIQPILARYDPPARTGRPRGDPRRALDGILHQARSGCQWQVLPREFGSKSFVHATLQRWVRLGVLERIWAVLIEGCAELGGVDWRWQSADAVLGKARLGGIKSAPTPPTAAKTARNAA